MSNPYGEPAAGLSLDLLAVISTNIGMPAEYLHPLFRPVHTSFLRLNYYPMDLATQAASRGRAASDATLGIHQHTDAGALTVLVQDDVPGLEVEHEGRWIIVEPTPEALVVNIGDIVQVWSNDPYRAALHHVRASTDQPRYSRPFFLSSSNDTDYAPLPSMVGPGRPARYRPIRWGEFPSLRAAGDYADLGDEVQIGDFRIIDPDLETSSESPECDGLLSDDRAG